MPVLSRAAACIARVSSDKPKNPCICTLRVTNAIEVQSASGRRAQNTTEAACRSLFRACRATPLVPATWVCSRDIYCIILAKRAGTAPFLSVPTSWCGTHERTRSQQHRQVVQVVVERRNDVDLASRTAARTHSNMVKQRGRVRAALCEDIRLGQLMAATQRIRCPFFWHLLKAVAHKVE